MELRRVLIDSHGSDGIIDVGILQCPHCQKRFSHSGSYSSHMSSKKCTAAAQASSNVAAFNDQMILYRALIQQFQAAQSLAYPTVNPYAAFLQQQLIQVDASFRSIHSSRFG